MCSHTSRYLEVVHADSGISLMIFGKNHEHDVMLPIWYVSSQMCTVKPGEEICALVYIYDRLSQCLWLELPNY